jgi:hypothetical protein
MLRPLPLVLLAPCLGCLISLAGAAPPEEAVSPGAAPAAAKQGNRTSYVSIVRGRGGQQTLVIDYRWKLHRDASVEVQLVPAEARSPAVAPLYFASEYFKRDVSRKVFHCLDAADMREAVDSFTQDKIDFEIIGRRNWLGRAAVVVLARDTPEPAHGKEVKTVDSPRAAFLMLECWALGDQSLGLDLPRDRFAPPGTLHVWFLRSNRVLWEETVAWPGYGGKAEDHPSDGARGRKAEGTTKDEE